MRLIVVERHKSNYPNPIHFKKGERLSVGKKDSEFEGWIWVKTQDENQGWAPVQYLKLEDENNAIATHDYTAREIDTCEGDALLLEYELNGWGWVLKLDGSCGWVPLNKTRPASQADSADA